MADNLATIEQQIDNAVNSRPEFSAQSPSNIAIYKGWRSAIAFVYNMFQRQEDDYEARIQKQVDEKQFGTSPWWQECMLAYQHGDLLLFINKRYQYAAVDPGKRVINLCSVIPVSGVIKLKCAMLVNGSPQRLTPAQIAGAQSYANERRPAGTYPVVESYDADLLRLYLKVFYNPQGGLSTLQAAVQTAIVTYLATLDFDGVLYTNKLIDAIQSVPGIIKDQVFIKQIIAKPSNDPAVEVVSNYQAEAGYFLIDPAFRLADTLEFIAV